MSEHRSTFLSLPQELRDHIYEDLLSTTFLVESPRPEKIISSLPLHQHAHLAILRVSRSTYEEAKRVLYRHGHFRFNAFSKGSPPLHEAFKNMSVITLLRNITLHLDVGTAFSLGYIKLDFAGVATRLVNHIAKLDPAVPRKRCVVEIDFVLDQDFLLGPSKTAWDFKDALGRLTGFDTVEVKIGHLKMRLGGAVESMIPLYNALDEMLAMTLGKGKGRYEMPHFCLVYHPRRG
ncbi:MAG: hypothetical protein ASARMPREDX12_000973 [Alectoria sarmentosa]|nr:MAG: hypothetical protein ASARMPREDX12_000973 [Alectoria sarmentosa]